MVPDRPLRAGAALRFAPLALFVSAAVYLAAVFDELPARWPVHYGPSGAADAWIAKSIWAAFAPLLFGLLIWAAIEIATTAAARSTLSPRADVSRGPHEATLFMARLVNLAVAFVTATFAVRMPVESSLGLWLYGPLLGVMAALVVGGRAVSVALEAARRADPDTYRGYNLLFYKNADDPRLWVPKVVGIGWTLNFARWEAYLLLAGVLAIPIGSLLLGLIAASR
jgi:uncharacterized membrane protein